VKLNQSVVTVLDLKVGSASFTYYANGNLTSDGSNSNIYDPENRLVSVAGGHRDPGL
jgi:hypothetical protein